MTARERTSRSSPKSRNASSFVCTTITETKRASICRKWMRSAGTAIFRILVRDSVTDFVCTDRGSPTTDIDAIRRRCFSIHTEKRSMDTCDGMKRFFRITSTILIIRRTTPTARRSCRSRSSRIRISIGAMIVCRARRGTRRSFTKFTSKDSRSGIRPFLIRSAALTRRSRIRRS